MLLAYVIMIYNGPIVYSVHSSNLVRKKNLIIRRCVCVWLLFQELFKSEGWHLERPWNSQNVLV